MERALRFDVVLAEGPICIHCSKLQYINIQPFLKTGYI